MICYKDKWFCNFYYDCKLGKKCDRALTLAVRAKAEKWMKNAPICTPRDKPECFKEKK